MVYSQAKVVAGGLAHIPIAISVFYFILTSFNKRALKFAEAKKQINNKSKVLESETEEKPMTINNTEMKESREIEVKEDKSKSIKELSSKLEEIEKKAEIVKEKVNKGKKKNEKSKIDMKRD